MRGIEGMALVQTSDLQDITDVEQLSQDDANCLNELRGVLEKYQRTSRFGVALLHKHFELASDEILVEHCNVEERLLVTQPKKITELGDMPLVKTIFAFDTALERNCEPYCPTDAKGRHQGRKDHY